MKNAITRVISFGALALLAFVVGCTTTKQREDMLAAAGFKIIAATTPQQQAHLKTLPKHKLTMVQKDGKIFFVFPDAKQNVLYVGQQAQYDAYQKAYQQAMLVAEQESAAAMNNDAWAAWGGPWW